MALHAAIMPDRLWQRVWGRVAEAVVHGETGLLIENGDGASLAEAIAFFLDQ